MPTALVIGASRGIGLECARQYRADGWRVLATARDAAGGARVAALGAEPLELDVARAESLSGFVSRIEGEKIDVAIYVAGVYAEGGASNPPPAAEFDRVMHPNVLGAMRLIPSVAPRVAAAAGRFVFISSGMGSIGNTDSSYGWLYRVSKAALNMAVHASQPDYPDVIMVAMDPGWVRTDMGGAGAPLSVEESVAGMRRTIARLGRGDRGSFQAHDGRARPW